MQQNIQMKAALVQLACAVLLICAFHASQAQITLSEACPGNLIVNGDFETPNTEVFRSQVDDPSNNPKWAWYYNNITGWYTQRPDGSYCVKVDWQRNYIELARGALATPIEGKQYGELLPNGTGNYCQDLKLQKGAKYRLSWYFGRLMTYAKGTKTWTIYDTSMDVAIKPSGYRTPPTGIWPKDKQGFTIIGSADNAEDFAKHNQQWVRHEVEFTAPANEVTLALINTKRPKSCGACGSLIDAVCLQNA